MITAEEFIREKIRTKNDIKGSMSALFKYMVTGEDALRWAHEFAEIKNKKVCNDKETKIIYLAIDENDDFNSSEKAFENKQDVIDFCVNKNNECPNENWVWKEIFFSFPKLKVVCMSCEKKVEYSAGIFTCHECSN